MGEYVVNYSDPAKNADPIRVKDGTRNTLSTSLTLIGKNYPGYGQAIAENLVHLLENFASPVPPSNPIEGQIWFDTSDPTNKKLRINDGGISGAKWSPINGVFQQPETPTNVKVGDIWVDTAKNQLNFYNGTQFVLVGPSYSSSKRTGSLFVTLTDINSEPQNVIISYVDDVAVEIVSFSQFTPNPRIDGFTTIYPGINLSNLNAGTENNPSYPIINANADSASSLQVSNPSVQKVPANSFLRNDIDQRTIGSFHVATDISSLKIGSDPTFILSRRNQYKSVLTNTYGNTGEFVFEFGSNTGTVLTIQGNRTVTINSLSSANSSAGLQVYGSARVSNSATVSTLFISSTSSNDVSISGNSVQVSGGIGVAGTLLVTGKQVLTGSLLVGAPQLTPASYAPTSLILPTQDNNNDIGDPNLRWKTVYGKVFTAGSSEDATFVGIATKAARLSSSSTFSVTGDMTAPGILFSGNAAPVALTVTANAGLISNKASTSTSIAVDSLLLLNQTDQLLYKHTKRDFLKDVNYQDDNDLSYNTATSTPSGSLVPIGTIVPYAGTTAPNGWLICDGQDIGNDPNYGNLRNVVGRRYDPLDSDFLLPDLQNTLLSGLVPINYIIKY